MPKNTISTTRHKSFFSQKNLLCDLDVNLAISNTHLREHNIFLEGRQGFLQAPTQTTFNESSEYLLKIFSLRESLKGASLVVHKLFLITFKSDLSVVVSNYRSPRIWYKVNGIVNAQSFIIKI